MIAREGIPFLLPAWIGALVLSCLYYLAPSVWLLIPLILALLVALFVTYFFRDPERTPPDGENLILSPGDGRVILIEAQTDGNGKKLILVSIFLSVFNVHVNRIPISGKVTKAKHIPGKYLKAFERAAVTENERTEIVIESAFGPVRFGQVAGIIARRIVCYLRGNETVTRGERFGLIRFGSRVDLFLCGDVEVKVAVGDRVKGGESVIGTFRRNG
jgi:phosphatidylserine decarboxylase